VDTYAYFGDPVYVYSLKNGINDGFLTPFKVKQIQTTMDYYTFTSDDTVIEGEIEVGRMSEGEMPRLRQAAMRVPAQNQGEGETRRRKGTDDPAHDHDELLAS